MLVLWRLKIFSRVHPGYLRLLIPDEPTADDDEPWMMDRGWIIFFLLQLHMIWKKQKTAKILPELNGEESADGLSSFSVKQKSYPQTVWLNQSCPRQSPIVTVCPSPQRWRAEITIERRIQSNSFFFWLWRRTIVYMMYNSPFSPPTGH